jgi:uncharacterized membrane protein YgdD (TMEM256/DUF423 family)
MNISRQTRSILVLGFFFLALAVMIGAFGAHGLKNLVTPEKLEIFETGVRYHFFHSFGLVIIAFFSQVFHQLQLKISIYSFILGIFLFSFNCYVYVLTSQKIFAMMMPIGGLLFMVGWLRLAWISLKLK